jgi:uncharacterized protein
MNNQVKRPVALVTGASSGIGQALAVLHAQCGGDLIVTARRQGALEKLKTKLESEHKGIHVAVVVADLSKPDGAQSVYDQVKVSGLQVDYLINNAGFGGYGSVVDRNLQDDLSMIQVNVTSMVTLTHLIADDMVQRTSGGKILNVGSIAGFVPGPYQATYHATKAFVSSFTQAVDHELRDKGVTCTVLAPGVTDETEFYQTAHLEGTKLAQGRTMSAEVVAKIGYNAMLAGKLLVISDWKDIFLPFAPAILPRRTILKIAEDLYQKSD